MAYYREYSDDVKEALHVWLRYVEAGAFGQISQYLSQFGWRHRGPFQWDHPKIEGTYSLEGAFKVQVDKILKATRKRMKKIAVLGLGVVGNALKEGMKHAYEVLAYDKFKPDVSNVPDLAAAFAADGPIFICVPTPMNPDGSCNLSIVESVLSELDDLARASLPKKKFKVVVIKSTVPPGTTEAMDEKFEKLRVVFNPEFLTEARPVEDFKNQDRIIIGGHSSATQVVADVYRVAYPKVPIIQCRATAAEMVKYVGNCFLAMKVSFANEIYQICQAIGVDYDTVINSATLDQRLGKSHWKVPGPDGHFGFGLTCFPKDLNALMHLAASLGVDAKMLRATWEKNLEVRPERDWEQMKGRAVL